MCISQKVKFPLFRTKLRELGATRVPRSASEPVPARPDLEEDSADGLTEGTATLRPE